MGNFGFDRNRECTMMGFNCKMSEYGGYWDCDYKKWDQKLKERTRISEWYKQLLQNTGLMKKGGKSKDRSSYSPIYAYHLSRRSSQHTSNRRTEKQKIEARLYFSPSCHQQVLLKTISLQI